MPKKKSSLQYDLSIVIPAYREEKRIGKTLDELALYLEDEKNLWPNGVEVVVVAADTTDKTTDIVITKQSKFTTLKLLQPGPKVGKGRDVQYGMMRGQGETIMFMDADLATPLKHLSKLYKSYQHGADVAIATRNLRKHHPHFLRRLVSNGGNVLFRMAGGVWVEDSQCGFKLFSMEAARVCFSQLTILGWGFDMEVLAIAKANGYKIKSYRVNDWVSVPEGTFEDSTFKNSLRSLNELRLISCGRLTRQYRLDEQTKRNLSHKL